MQKKPWRKLTLLVLLAAALCYCVLAVNGVGNQLQYLIEAPAYEATKDSGACVRRGRGQAERKP